MIEKENIYIKKYSFLLNTNKQYCYAELTKYITVMQIMK